MSTTISTQSKRFTKRGAVEVFVAKDQIQSLRQLALELQHQLETLKKSEVSTVEGALDFYTEVQRFEIALIKQALRVASGSQRKAAELLNLNSTTLNAMIKRYRIKTDLLPD
jgi:transcriptional regulator with PAS, ATPase and Fis domain